jgi:hypothetical protein
VKLLPLKIMVLAFASASACAVTCKGPGGQVAPSPPEARTQAGDSSADQIAAIRLRSAAKFQLAREVAAGRRTLEEAAALFCELDRLPPAAGPAVADLFNVDVPVAARTAAERACRQVINFVSVAVPGEAGAAAEARLVAHYRAEVARRGTVRLPDPAALTPVRELLDQARAALAAVAPPSR